MSQGFRSPVDAMDRRQKEWFATAMVSIVTADGTVTQEEVDALMDAIGFVKDPDSLDRLKKFIAYCTPPPMAAFAGWEKEPKKRAAMLLDLMEVAVADQDLSPKEQEKFYEIGKILGFSKEKIGELLVMGKSKIQ